MLELRSSLRLPLLVLAALAAYAAVRQFDTGATAMAWAAIGVAALLACLAFGATESVFSEARLMQALRRARLPAVIGVGLCVLGLALNALAAALIYSQAYRPVMAYLWLASLIAALAGLALVQQGGGGGLRATWRSIGRWEIAAFAGIVVLTVLVRVWQLDRIPPGIFIDETNAGIDALHVLDGRPDSPFATGWYETPNLYIYYLASLIGVFGPSLLTLKLASILPAILTVVALYPLARTLFGAPVAVASTALFAVARWHLILSRWGWNELGPPLFHILGVLFLVRATRNRRWLEFALCGVMLGLCMYTYLASRLCVLAVALYVLYRIIFERGFLRRNWAGLMVAAVAYLATFAPLATTYVRNPFTFLNRSQQVSIFNDIDRAGSAAPLLDSVRRHVEMFTVAGDNNPRHNLPGAPMLDPVTGALFLMGIGYAVWRINDHRRALALTWVGVTMLGGVLSSVAEAPQAYRTLTALPMVALLAGDTLARSGVVIRDGLSRLGSGVSPRLATAVALAATGALAVRATSDNLTSFFGSYAASPAVYVAFTPTENAVAKDVMANIGRADLYLSDVLYNFGPPRFLTYRPASGTSGGVDRPPYSEIDIGSGLPVADRGRDALLLLDRSMGWAESFVRQFYPGATFEAVRGPRNEVLFNRIAVESQALSDIQGLRGEYDGTIRRDANVDFRFPADFPSGTSPRRIIWAGSLRVPTSGLLRLRGDGGLALWLDDDPFVEPRFVGRGLHALRITQTDPSAQGRAALYWQLAGGSETIVPPDALTTFELGKSGLTAAYYRSENWTGPVAFTQTAPALMIGWPTEEPWPGPFSIAFNGYITAPVAGRYTFRVDADDGARLTIDGQKLGEGLIPNQPNAFEAGIDLSAGRHPIRLDYFQRGGGKRLELWWTPPGSTRVPVPPEVLSHD